MTPTPFAPIRVMHEKTTLVVRDAFAIHLVCTGTRAQLAPGLSIVLERYLAFVPAGALRWVRMGANSTKTRAFKGKADTSRAKMMLRNKRRGTFFWFASDDDAAKPADAKPDDPAFLVLMSVDDASPNKVIELRMSSSFVWERGVDAIVAFVAEIVALIRNCQSGTAGLELAIHPDMLAWQHRAGAVLPKLGAKHPGFLFGDVTSLTIRDEPFAQLRGIGWLTILGPALARRWARVAKAAGATLVPAGKSTIVRIGEAPSPKPEPLRFAKVTKALLPVTQLDDPFQRVLFKCAYGKRAPLAFAAWEFRFVGGLDGAKRHLGAQRDVESQLRRGRLAIAEGDVACAARVVAALEAAKADRDEVNKLRYALAEHAEDTRDRAEMIRWYDALLAAGLRPKTAQAIEDKRARLLRRPMRTR